jgi:hypothetical protein
MNLCITTEDRIPNRPTDRAIFFRRRFAWSCWNLFNGWNSTYRTDDPKRDYKDRNEKVRPLSFNPQLWECVQALYGQIRNLKSFNNPKTIKDVEAILKAENGLFNCLSNLNERWKAYLKNRNHARIHLYDSADWEFSGNAYGHHLYMLKKSIE